MAGAASTMTAFNNNPVAGRETQKLLPPDVRLAGRDRQDGCTASLRERSARLRPAGASASCFLHRTWRNAPCTHVRPTGSLHVLKLNLSDAVP